MTQLFDTNVTVDQYTKAFTETVYMVSISLFIGALLGIPLAIILVVTRPGGLKPNKWVYSILNVVVNIIRSVPFIILMVAIVPLTRLISGTSIGTTAALVPLTIFIAPYISRLIEASLPWRPLIPWGRPCGRQFGFSCCLKPKAPSFWP